MSNDRSEQRKSAEEGPADERHHVAWLGQPGYVLARTRAEVEYKTRKDQNPTIAPLYDQAELDAAVAAECERCDLLRGLLCEAINMGENWPGIAYTADLKRRCKDALPGWEPEYGW